MSKTQQPFVIFHICSHSKQAIFLFLAFMLHHMSCLNVQFQPLGNYVQFSLLPKIVLHKMQIYKHPEASLLGSLSLTGDQLRFTELHKYISDMPDKVLINPIL